MATYGIVPPRDVNLPAAVTDGAPFMLLFHATSNPDKKWPANHWAALATRDDGAWPTRAVAVGIGCRA